MQFLFYFFMNFCSSLSAQTLAVCPSVSSGHIFGLFNPKLPRPDRSFTLTQLLSFPTILVSLLSINFSAVVFSFTINPKDICRSFDIFSNICRERKMARQAHLKTWQLVTTNWRQVTCAAQALSRVGVFWFLEFWKRFSAFSCKIPHFCCVCHSQPFHSLDWFSYMIFFRVIICITP